MALGASSSTQLKQARPPRVPRCERERTFPLSQTEEPLNFVRRYDLQRFALLQDFFVCPRGEVDRLEEHGAPGTLNAGARSESPVTKMKFRRGIMWLQDLRCRKAGQFTQTILAAVRLLRTYASKCAPACCCFYIGMVLGSANVRRTPHRLQ